MIGSGAYNYINVLDRVADASWLRNEAISNNLSNKDTPNYKRKDVEFESYLMSALTGDGSLDENVAGLDMSTVKPSSYTEYSNLSYRYDGNNVDISLENAELAKNQIRYNTLIDSVTQEFSRLKAVLTR